MASYVIATNSRGKHLLESRREMSDDDMEKFGKKDADAYPFFVIVIINGKDLDHWCVVML